MKRYLADDDTPFTLSAADRQWAKDVIAQYPPGRSASAILPLLQKVQQRNGGWLSKGAICCVADLLGLPEMRVIEIASFYSMFQFAPVGKFFVQLCGTTPCWLRGAQKLKDVCVEKIGQAHVVSADGQLSWQEVECLGACANAPMAQINDHYYEDLTPERFGDLLDDLRHGKPVAPGPQPARSGDKPLRRGAEAAKGRHP